ncbi:MAG TPA: hypothetical protein VK543_06600 [Puia sp.]|nr:hypothetical protein [Puia sp.]
MKRSLRLAIPCLLICFNNLHAQIHTLNDLQGEWESTDKGKKGSVHFMDDNKILMIFPNGQMLRGVYQVNFSKDPVDIDIIRSTGDTLQGLVEFLDDVTIRWKIFPLHNRTDNLSKQKNTSVAIFKRKKYISIKAWEKGLPGVA